MLSEQYLKFNSIINIKLTTNFIYKLPAFTICYNKLFSFQKLALRYPEYQEIYKKYTKFLIEFSSNKLRFNKSYEENITKGNKLYSKEYYKLLRERDLNNLEGKFPKENYLDIFDNLLIDFINGDDTNERLCIEITISSDKGERPNFKDLYLYFIKSIPIESINLRSASKCFTYFYEKEITYFNKTLNIVALEIKWDFYYTWFPFDERNGISFAIHPQNNKPTKQSFHNIEQNTRSNVYFSKVEEKRLMYYDNCREYNKMNNNFKTRIDCLEDCIFKSTSRFCHDRMRRSSEFLLFRNQLSNLTIYEDRKCKKKKTYIELLNYCKNKCEEECYQAYYLTSIEKFKGVNEIQVQNVGRFITIEPSSNPNILIEHLAEITLISLICNFGGLIGMYLGISLYSVSCDVWDVLKKLLSKFILIRIANYFTQNNRQNNILININYSIKQKFRSLLRR